MRRRGFEGAPVNVALDASTFEEFFSTEYPRLVPLLQVLLGDRPSAESVAAAVLHDERRSWDAVDDNTDRSAKVMVAGVSRATGRRSPSTRLERPGDQPATNRQPLPDRELWDIVKELPKRQRSVLVLHYVGQLPLGQVANLVRCSPVTLSTQLNHAFDTLTTRLPVADRSDARVDPGSGSSHREQIDSRLRAAGAKVAALAPSPADTALALASWRTTERRRRRRWLVPAGLVAGSAAAAITIVSMIDRGQPEASADLAPSVTLEVPSTSVTPTTDAATETTDGRTEIIEPTPSFSATFDEPTGWMWVSTDWNWDEDGGACITVSRQDEPPDADELQEPDAPSGCIGGDRHDVVLTARLGNRLIHLTKGNRPSDWQLAERPFSRGRCGRTADQLGLVSGSLYEITCIDSTPLVREFPQRPVDELHILTAGATTTASKVFDGDDEVLTDDERNYGLETTTGLQLYSTNGRCMMATVTGESAWYEACLDPADSGQLLLVTEERSYLVGWTSGALTAVSLLRPLDGAAFGCSADQLEALQTLGARLMWTGVACGDGRVVFTPAPTASDERAPTAGTATEYLVTGRHGQLAARGDEEAIRWWASCGHGFPCTEHGHLALFPVGAISPWPSGGGRPSIIDVTDDVRELVGDRPTDLATIGIRVSERPPGELLPTQPSLIDDFAPGIIIGSSHRLGGQEIRNVRIYLAGPQQTNHSTDFVVWTTRLTAFTDWTVRAAFRVTHCWDQRTGNPVECELPN